MRAGRRLPVFLAIGALLVLVAGGGFAALESDTVSNYWEGVWWALSLMTTVGFVGESPETTAGRVLSGVIMVFGFALVALTTAAIASLFVREEEEDTIAQQLDEVVVRLDRIERALGERRDA